MPNNAGTHAHPGTLQTPFLLVRKHTLAQALAIGLSITAFMADHCRFHYQCAASLRMRMTQIDVVVIQESFPSRGPPFVPGVFACTWSWGWQNCCIPSVCCLCFQPCLKELILARVNRSMFGFTSCIYGDSFPPS
jgi:hypothetical protein